MVKKTLFISIASGLVVTMWGLPSHFGYDPTCYLFRQTFDVSCWTESFQPKIRIFSTLGQPNWLAAYLAILLPISIAFFIDNLKPQTEKKYHVLGIMYYVSDKKFILNTYYILLTTLFYIAILYTGSRSGFLGLLSGGFVLFFLSKQKMLLFKFVIFPLLILSFFVGTPIDLQLKQLAQRFLPSFPKYQIPNTTYQPQGPALETGGTESGKIRLIVWRGAITAWLHNPIFGTGVETFAFAYYKYRPVEHNLTSEWDYLYNKAHNEYLNYLATTGVFGLGSYLTIIGTFLFFCLKNLKSQIIFGLLAAYISILVSNFLGFSVVIINIYFFLIPAFVFVLGGMTKTRSYPLYAIRYPLLVITPLILTTLYLLLMLYRFWEADKAYAKGYNLNRAGQYQYGYFDLGDAVEKRPSEPIFLDELSYNSGVLAIALASQDEESSDSAKIASYAARLTDETIKVSNKVVTEHPNNITFWKTRIRLLNLLSQKDSKYLSLALDAVKKASVLAPTDAKISYTIGILYGQNGEKQKAIEALEKATLLKPNYREAYYALALFYHDLATDKNSKVIDSTLQQKAIDTMQYILDHIASTDAQAQKALETWEKP